MIGQEALAIKTPVTYAQLVKTTDKGEIFEVIEQLPTRIPDILYTRVRFRRMLPDVPSESYAFEVLPHWVTGIGDLKIEEWLRSGTMKVKMLVDGSDGSKPVKADETVDVSADFAVRCMRLGHAEPVDEEGFTALKRYGDTYGTEVFAKNTLDKLNAWVAAQASASKEG